jgi:hypothetical protein
VDTFRCDRCSTPHEAGDNFCRRCGRGLSAGLPVVRPAAGLPQRSRALPSSLVGSVAVLALGTGLEWVARRLMGSAARAAGRSLVTGGRDQNPTQRQPQGEATIDELIYVRKVQLRR